MSFLDKFDKFVNDLFTKEQVKPKACCKSVEERWHLPHDLEEGESRRVFYIDVGDCPTEKAEEFLARLKEKFKGEKCCDKEVEFELCETECCSAGGCSLPLVEEVVEKTELFFIKGTTARAILLVKVDVGTLPPNKADEFVQKRIESYKGLLDRVPHDVGVMFMPGRYCGDNVEIVSLYGTDFGIEVKDY